MDHLIVSLLGLVAMLISLTVHEFSHALVGLMLGDETARRAGRLTLNPMSHIDPIGTVLIPLVGALSGLPVIGWAKPVPFNPYNLKYPKWGPTMVALAGPVSNFLGAAVYLLMLKFVVSTLGLPITNLLPLFLTLLAVVNIVLGVFNFIPVPPLDGSNVLKALLDHPKHRNTVFFLETKGPMILFAIIILDFMSPSSFLGRIFNAAIEFFFTVFGLNGVLGLF